MQVDSLKIDGFGCAPRLFIIPFLILAQETLFAHDLQSGDVKETANE